jgi:chromosome partitioning protein
MSGVGKVVTVMNMKGGVGKTTISMHLSSLLAHHNISEDIKKVLVIDYDPQFNLSQSLLPIETFRECEENRKNILGVLVDDQINIDPFKLQKPESNQPPKVEGVITNLYVSVTGERRFDIVPSTLDLMYLALGRSEQALKTMEVRFSKFIDEAKQNYDLIIIDCHPAGSLFTKTSILSSDHVLIPVVPHSYASRGVGLMVNFMRSPIFQRNKAKIHVLFNHLLQGDISSELSIRGNERFMKLCLSNSMKKYSAYNYLNEGKEYLWESKKAYSTRAYLNMKNIATEFLERIK